MAPGPENNLVARFVRRSASFGTVLVGVKVLNFLFLFLFWRLLDPAHFGIIAVVQGVSMVLAPGLNLGLSNAISRLYKEYDKNGLGRDLLGSTFVIATVAAGLICAAIFFLGEPVFSAIFPSVPFEPYLRVGVVSAFFLSLCLFGDQIIRVTDRLRLNGILVIAELLLKNSLIFGFVLALADKAYAFLLGEMVALGFLSTAYAFTALRGSRLRLGWAFLRDPVKLALPIIPAGILSQLNNTLDRFVLSNFIPMDRLGLYSQAVKVSSILDILSRALKTVWFPTIIKFRPGDPGSEVFMHRSYLFTFDFLAFTVLGICLLGVPVIRLVAPEKYHAMCIFLPAVGFVMLMKNFIFLPSLRLLTTRFALASLISVTASTVVGLALHGIITTRFGIEGALLSLGGTYLFTYLIGEGLARTVYPVRLPWIRLGLRFLAFGAAMAGATFLIHQGHSMATVLVHLAGFCLTGVPIALIYYRRRRLIFESAGGERKDSPASGPA